MLLAIYFFNRRCAQSNCRYARDRRASGPQSRPGEEEYVDETSRLVGKSDDYLRMLSCASSSRYFSGS